LREKYAGECPRPAQLETPGAATPATSSVLMRSSSRFLVMRGKSSTTADAYGFANFIGATFKVPTPDQRDGIGM